MMKVVSILVSRPLLVFVQALTGSVCVMYLNTAITDSFKWFIPCFFATIADLATGVRAAKFRKENVSASTALRRTGNKMIVYASWVVFAVTCGIQFPVNWCTPAMMAIVLFIESISIIGNILEPHGLKFSWKGILNVIGRKHDLDGLGDIIENEEKK